MAYNFMGNDHSNEFGTQDIADNKIVCILAYIPFLFWIPLIAGNTSYCRFHANQGLLLLLTSAALGIAVSVVRIIIGWIPIIGWIILGLVSLAAWVIIVVLMIYGMVVTGQGNSKELPAIGSLARLIK
ncbi:MAG: hypothetical protein K2H01_08690 [Ruminococcus sp.]|nr:hypothetical protein [Ruminococcus sp.]